MGVVSALAMARRDGLPEAVVSVASIAGVREYR